MLNQKQCYIFLLILYKIYDKKSALSLYHNTLHKSKIMIFDAQLRAVQNIFLQN